MEEIKVLFDRTSTNGRWGVQIVGEPVEKWPVQGKLYKLGHIEGNAVFKLEQCESGQWIIPADDTVPMVGAEQVFCEDLQSNGRATITVGGPFFAIKSFGYKRRSSTVTAYKNGNPIALPASVLMAMGILPNSPEEVNASIPDIESPIAIALKKAGII